jgi:hypothetical protein
MPSTDEEQGEDVSLHGSDLVLGSASDSEEGAGSGAGAGSVLDRGSAAVAARALDRKPLTQSSSFSVLGKESLWFDDSSDASFFSKSVEVWRYLTDLLFSTVICGGLLVLAVTAAFFTGYRDWKTPLVDQSDGTFVALMAFVVLQAFLIMVNGAMIPLVRTFGLRLTSWALGVVSLGSLVYWIAVLLPLMLMLRSDSISLDLWTPALTGAMVIYVAVTLFPVARYLAGRDGLERPGRFAWLHLLALFPSIFLTALYFAVVPPVRLTCILPLSPIT